MMKIANVVCSRIIPAKIITGKRIVAVEYRDGTVIDVVRQVKGED